MLEGRRNAPQWSTNWSRQCWRGDGTHLNGPLTVVVNFGGDTERISMKFQWTSWRRQWRRLRCHLQNRQRSIEHLVKTISRVDGHKDHLKEVKDGARSQLIAQKWSHQMGSIARWSSHKIKHFISHKQYTRPSNI